MSLDELDLKILGALGKDARKSILDISKETHVSRPTISNRINRMVQEGLVSFTPNLDLGKLGFRMAHVGLSVKNHDKVRKFIELYSNCPRVLSISHPSAEFNLLICLWGEDVSTLEATIESMRNWGEGEIRFVHYSGPPIYPSKMYVQVQPSKKIESPCGKTCGECPAFIEGQCIGCPAVQCYKGPL